MSHFHCYLYEENLKIRTNHSTLQWLLRFRHLEGQLASWIEILEEYDFIIEFRPRKGHQNADALSRRPCAVHSCSHCDRIETRESIFKKNEGNFETNQVTGKLIERIVAAEDKFTKIISEEELRDQQLQDLHKIQNSYKVRSDRNGEISRRPVRKQTFFRLSGIALLCVKTSYIEFGKH